MARGSAHTKHPIQRHSGTNLQHGLPLARPTCHEAKPPQLTLLISTAAASPAKQLLLRVLDQLAWGSRHANFCQVKSVCLCLYLCLCSCTTNRVVVPQTRSTRSMSCLKLAGLPRAPSSAVHFSVCSARPLPGWTLYQRRSDFRPRDGAPQAKPNQSSPVQHAAGNQACRLSFVQQTTAFLSACHHLTALTTVAITHAEAFPSTTQPPRFLPVWRSWPTERSFPPPCNATRLVALG